MRIIAGKFKSRNIKSLNSDSYRPTKSIVREAVFNKIENGGLCELLDSKVLDLCCGSGILAFEALSRGAAKAVFLDKDRDHRQFIMEAAEMLEVESKVKFVRTDIEFLSLSNTKYNVVFMDPPYGQNMLTSLFDKLARYGWLSQGAILVAIMGRNDVIELNSNYRLISENLYGRSKVNFVEFLE